MPTGFLTLPESGIMKCGPFVRWWTSGNDPGSPQVARNLSTVNIPVASANAGASIRTYVKRIVNRVT